MPPLPLEEFDAADLPSARAQTPAQTDSPAPDDGKQEKLRLEGYEAGYQAGWDDAVRSETDDQSRIGAEFARNLQDLGFTFQEARSHVMHALEPLLTGMVDKVLPTLISETIGQTIVEELLPLAASAADAPIEVVVSPSGSAALKTMLAAATSVPFSLIEEPTLAEGQVFLRSGQTEKHLDMSGAVDRIGAAIDGLYQLNEKAFQHG